LVAIPAKYDFKPYAFGFQKDSPYVDLFNYFLTELKEMGVYDEIATKYQQPPQFCPDYSGQSLGFDSCIALFMVVGAGLFASICLFLIECILNYLYPELTWFSNSITPEENSVIRELRVKIKHLERQIKDNVIKRGWYD
jgi:hypothetical protein